MRDINMLLLILPWEWAEDWAVISLSVCLSVCLSLSLSLNAYVKKLKRIILIDELNLRQSDFSYSQKKLHQIKCLKIFPDIVKLTWNKTKKEKKKKKETRNGKWQEEFWQCAQSSLLF